jgi:leucyl aminopeptidase
MKLVTSNSEIGNADGDLIVIGVRENEFAITVAGFHHLHDADKAFVRQAQVDGFTGKVGEILIHHSDGRFAAKRALMVGVGKAATLDVAVLRKALVAAFKQVKALKVTEVTVAPLNLEGTGISRELFAENVALVAGLVDYVINHQKTETGGHKAEARLKELRMLTDEHTANTVRAGMRAGNIIARAVNHARDLSNEPAGTMTPKALARAAKNVADKSGGLITCKVLNRGELQKLGAKALLAVAQGSVQEPVLIEMTYTPPCGASREVLGFVGKSVTFDSGGLDIKTADGMRTMKRDMAGGASVLAAIGAVAALRLPVTVKAFMAATENMVDGKSYKPGDVLGTLKGLTVEVDNTDAEGRLTLADAIEYAKRQGVTSIVDLATLTGAQRSISADVGAAAFSNQDAFLGRVLEAAQNAGERLMPMEMWDEFREGNKSDMADLKNSGGDPGSITAAWFLREFAGEDTPWVHLDIAGPSYRNRELGMDPKGSTGFGVRTLVELARLYCQK